VKPSFPSCAVLLGLSACGAVGYRPAPLAPDRPLRPADPLPTPLGFEAAVRYAVEHNPDLVALRARADAVNVNPPREPVEVGAGLDADHRFEGTASLDALSLLGLGRRPSEVALACARRSEAWMAHHARAREVAGEIAEAFVVERVLAALTDPDLQVDTAVYVRAGLESSTAESAEKATRAEWAAEQAERAAERRANRLALTRLLGVGDGREVVPAAPAGAWPPLEQPTPSLLIRARADVQQRIASFEVADRDLRRAVAVQYPSLRLEPGIAADPTSLFGAVRLSLPVGARSEVRAAEAAREAARADVESAVLDAVREAAESRARHEAAVVAASAASQRLEASTGLFRASRTRLQVAAGSVVETVLAADAVVAAAKGHRETALEEARARVRAARAAGWPHAP
jgi:outer membrane protein TolC